MKAWVVTEHYDCEDTVTGVYASEAGAKALYRATRLRMYASTDGMADDLPEDPDTLTDDQKLAALDDWEEVHELKCSWSVTYNEHEVQP